MNSISKSQRWIFDWLPSFRLLALLVVNLQLFKKDRGEGSRLRLINILNRIAASLFQAVGRFISGVDAESAIL